MSFRQNSRSVISQPKQDLRRDSPQNIRIISNIKKPEIVTDNPYGLQIPSPSPLTISQSQSHPPQSPP